MSLTGMISLSNLELSRFFLAIVLLVMLAHSFGYLFKKFKLPPVIGEILAGLILGPTILGYFLPEVYTWIFNAFDGEGKLISVIYWIGLILLMFISGFELKTSFNRSDKKTIMFLLVGATCIPFIAGWLAPKFYDFSPYVGVAGNDLALTLVIAIAVAVTSIPVISKIFMDLHILDTHFAKIVLATATIQDVLLWVALAIATGLVGTNSASVSSIAGTVLVTLVFFVGTLVLMPKFFRFTNKLRVNVLLRSSVAGYTLVICFLFAAIASILEVNIVFGAFLAGIVVGTMPEDKFGTVKKHIKEIALAFFVPVYFAVVGLKLDLVHHFDVTFFLGFLIFTTLFETIGTVLAAKFIKKDWLSSLNLAVAMNTRGGPGIILATVALDMGIINETFFVTLVMIAIVTSLFAGYWFNFVLRKGWTLLQR